MSLLSTGLHDLPTELLYEILSYPFLTYEHFGVAQLSRRLNSIAMPRFLAYHKIRVPVEEFSAVIETGFHHLPMDNRELFLKERDTLAALALAFNVKSIDHLTCTFYPYSRGDYDDYHRLVRILGRLDRVGSVTIMLDMTDFSVKRATWLAESVWKSVMRELLNVCVEKGCQRLTVISTEAGEASFDDFLPRLPTVNMVLRKVRRISHLPRKLGIVTPPTQPYTGHALRIVPLTDTASRSAQLRHMQISCIMLLYPPYLSLAHSILGTAALTSLELSGIYTPMGTKAWRRALYWLLYPLRSRLLKLTIHHCSDLPAATLFQLLIQLKSLTSLTLAAIPEPNKFSPDFQVENHFLPNLVALHTTPEWVMVLCPGTMPRPRFDTLSFVEVPDLMDPYHTRTFDFGAYLQNMQRVFLDSTFSLPESGSPVDVALDLSTVDYPASHFVEDLLKYEDPDDRAALYLAFDRVTIMAIPAETVWLWWGSQSKCDRFCIFLSWWRNLHCVELSFEYEGSPPWVTKVDPDDVFSKLVKSAKRHCPSVRRFIIGRKEYMTAGR
ncbi:hypothetical protein BDN72DRAFT_901221 [Pluteus cervinus]|uniref:Uncharacterized protein n=1 Tax=Pluteus cervinus TaxID=181527 RepID=A0ACD3AGP0_9AGAR|nr:hypothetical protein BDN72DRAFT_901221 [Pluteus cervinus]